MENLLRSVETSLYFCFGVFISVLMILGKIYKAFDVAAWEKVKPIKATLSRGRKVGGD